MAIYYLDYVNGNDANDGSTWALAWETITSGATAARIAPGDTIRIAKSPDPTSLGQTATWTNLSKTVTLTSAVTANVDLCETAWTASANVTSSTTTVRKEGAAAVSLAIASAFTTGLVAYKTLTSTDYSGYQQLSFWIRNNAAIAANKLKLCLCSDTAGATIVDEFVIPAIPSTNRYVAFTINKGAALGTAIQSVALYAIADPGVVTVILDNIIAVKAASAADSLSLTSLISKNSAAYGGNEGWYGIQSINGVTVLLDNDTETLANAGRGYSGTTETVTTYKRETIKTALASTISVVVQEVQNSGTNGSPITFSGGWNTATTVQDGDTFFSGENGYGYGLQLNGKSYITIERIAFSKYYIALIYASSNNNTATVSNANNSGSGLIYTSSNNNTATVSNANNNSSDGLYYYSSNNTATVSNANNNGSDGLYYYTSNNNTATVSNANNNGYYGLYYFSNSNNNTATVSNANNNGYYGLYYSTSNNNTATVSTTGNAVAGVFSNSTITLLNSSISEATEVTGLSDYHNHKVYSNKHDNTTDNHKIFTDGGVISSEPTVRHTASGIAWSLSPTSANRSSGYPLSLPIAQVAVTANNLVTVKAWMRRDNTGLTMRLVCKGGQIAGVSSDVVASMTAAANTWEELTITFTPTEAGVVEITAEAWGGTTYSGFVDDMTITQA